MDIANKMPLEEDSTGVDICFDPAFFAYREVFLVMGDRALYLTFNDEIFVS